MEIGNGTRLDWCRFADLPAALLYEMLRFRQAIFVVEQRCAYPDLDGLDQCADHLFLRVDDALAGYLRLIPHPDEQRVSIGRVAVAESRRRRGLARLMMTNALAQCRHDRPDWTIILGAQTYLVPFYESLGFRAISGPYDDYGIPHIDMALADRP